MEYSQPFEEFILREAHETSNFEAFLSQETAVFTRQIDKIAFDKQITILDADSESNLLALGLSFQGHQVHSVKKTEFEMLNSSQLGVHEHVKYFYGNEKQKFDVIILANNAISQYMTENELYENLNRLFNVLNKNGMMLIMPRFYDQLLRAQSKNYAPQQIQIGNKRCIQLSVWDWLSKNNCTYLQDYYTIQQADKDYLLHHSSRKLRAWRRAEINLALSQVGFIGIQYHSDTQNSILISARKF